MSGATKTRGPMKHWMIQASDLSIENLVTLFNDSIRRWFNDSIFNEAFISDSYCSVRATSLARRVEPRVAVNQGGQAPRSRENDRRALQAHWAKELSDGIPG